MARFMDLASVLEVRRSYASHPVIAKRLTHKQKGRQFEEEEDERNCDLNEDEHFKVLAHRL